MTNDELTCPKIIYESREMAAQRARTNALGCRPYVCPDCGGWHLTRQSKAASRRVRKILRRRTALPAYGWQG